MKAAANIERLIKKFCDTKKSSVTASAEMDERILDDVFAAYEKSQRKESGASQPNLWRIIMKGRTIKLAAAAVIIVAALIGMKVLFGLGGQPAEVPVAEPVVSDAGLEDSDSQVDIELRQVRQMYAAGDVKGLAAMLAEGQFESKVVVANYLAQMEGGVEALEALENVQAEYGKDDPGNPFTPAVERIRNNNKPSKGGVNVGSGVSRYERQPEPGPGEAVATGTVEGMEARRVSVERVSASGLSQEAQETGDEALLRIMADDTRSGPELVAGVSGKAYYFDGIGDYIEVGSIEGLGPEQTKMLWVFAEPYTRPHSIYLIDEGGDKSNNNWIELIHPDPNGAAEIRAGFDASNMFDSNGKVAPGYWCHIAVVSTAAGEVETYINGVLDSWRAGFSSRMQPENIVIGTDGETRRACFKGIIDDVAIFNRPLSADEIRRLYQNPGSLRGNEAGLVGYWNFDNDEGELVKDASPYGNHGTLGNSEHSGLDSPRDVLPAEPEPPADGESKPELTEGVSGKGYYFDGSGDHIEIGAIEGLGVEQTKMLWIYPEAWPMPRDVYVLDEGGDESNNNWIELLDSDGNGLPNIRAGFDGGNLFDSNGNMEVGYWYHIAVVSTSAGGVSTYINGIFDSSQSGFSATTEPKAIVIGADGETRGACFKGIIDEVAIFDRALSEEEIWKIYQNTGRLRGFEPGLVGYWNFDYDDGDIVRDRSRNGNDGKLGSADSSAAGVSPRPAIRY